MKKKIFLFLGNLFSRSVVVVAALALALGASYVIAGTGFCLSGVCKTSWGGSDTVVRLSGVRVYGPGGADGNVLSGTYSFTWSKPASLSYVVVEAWGAGGGQGCSNGVQGGPGGGGGAYGIQYIPAGSLGATVAVAVGARGVPQTSSGASPTSGGASSFGGFLSSAGGVGGNGSQFSAGGAGGVTGSNGGGTGASINGSSGGTTYQLNSGGWIGGVGGGSPRGGAGNVTYDGGDDIWAGTHVQTTVGEGGGTHSNVGCTHRYYGGEGEVIVYEYTTVASGS